MGARVTMRVELPGGEPARGAQIEGTNHDAWDPKHKSWPGTTGQDGTWTWTDMDTGTLGDRYTFGVSYTDPQGVEWAAEISQRISSSMTIPVVLHRVARHS